jgi:hypothetical protein
VCLIRSGAAGFQKKLQSQKTKSPDALQLLQTLLHGASPSTCVAEDVRALLRQSAGAC